jgi:uncharacterized protein GlcG (DUF336 family)
MAARLAGKALSISMGEAMPDGLSAISPASCERKHMELNAHQARTVIEGAEARARELGLPVVIAVLDGGAHLKAFQRMDGAVLASIDIAIRKASTAVLFQANSEVVWEYCKPGAPAPGLQLTNGGLATFGGGIPLKAPNGAVVGALGVSGGTVAQDMDVAGAGLAAFQGFTG